ncbi:MAG: PKD domain-containing protein [Bacteroidetes bacterium]|nr:MAG: PKD domain-containing protein [Bacteroidota bacterium]
MKKQLFPKMILLAAGMFCTSLFAQDWVSKMQDQNANFFEVQKTFNEYAANYTASYKLANNGAEPAKIPGEKLFRRWEWKMAPRVSANGELPAPNAVWNAMESYKKGMNTLGAGAWTFIGPAAVGSMYGAGRLNFIRVHPTNPNILYVGSPSGGLWISTNGGTSWTTNTDLLPSVIGCSDIAIDPTNTNVMYLATGDGDAGDNSTVGVLKSTDGALIWNKTGLTFAMGVGRMISRILINPTNTNVLIVATSNGIYRSTDAGVTFTQAINATTTLPVAGSFKDVEFKPGDPNTVYACGSEFFKSTNGGQTWTKVSSGVPAANLVSRMAIAVTAADPTVVYMIVGKPGPSYGTEGFYKSTTSGASFTKPSTPNIGTQQWYDLCIAANPTNAQEILLGGQTEFLKSTNGGTAWNDISGSTHVDYHDVMYTNGTTCYLSSDGGVWKSTANGSSWTDLSDGLAIAQMYGFGQSATNPNLLIQGWQDNGTNLYTGSWSATNIGGDGMKAVISWGNDANKWGTSQYGRIMRSTGGSFSPGTTGITEYTGAAPNPWVTEIVEDPSTANTLYCGFSNVWKSTDGASSWTKLGTIGSGTVNVQAIAAVPTTNGQTIWAAKGGTLYKTTNGGTSWVVQAGGIPNGNISDIVVHPTDVNKAWVTFSGFSNAIKVYGTSNQGASWTNLSGSVPNVPVNCIEIDKNGNDALYIGTDAGVFFKDATMSVWQPFSQGLPNVMVTQLNIYYAGSKIRASTYGRGMWESALYAPGAYPPDANFTANNFIGCPGLGVQFTDYSAGSPTSWVWSFPGGNPSSSTQQNPFVAYNTPGTYSVSLTVTNANGNNTESFTNYITISNSTNVAPVGTGTTICGPVSVTLSATASAPGTVRWWNQAAGGAVLGSDATPPYTFTSTLWGTQTLYVDEAFSAAGIDLVGATDKTIGSGDMFSANDIRGLYFDVFKPVVINTVKVYAQSAGLRTIEIIDENGNMVTDTTVNIPASSTTPATVTINRTVYPGNNYFMKFRGTVNCFRNSSGPAYPYDDGGSNAVRITNSNAGAAGYYYFFYDWQFTNIVCNTGRTPVVITDTCSLTGITDLFANRALDIYPNPNNGQFTVSFNIENQDNFTVKITNAIGQNVYEEPLNDFSGKYEKKLDIGNYGKGVYQLSITNSKNETVKKVMVY